MRWEDEHDDPNTEPYTVIHIRRVGEVLWKFNPKSWSDDELPIMLPVPPGTYQFHVFFRNYRKRSWFSVNGRDELEAFMIANAHLAKNKAKADKRRATKQGADT